MAQPAHSIRSSFGLQCCLLFLLAFWEAGATTFQEVQKSGESPASGHLAPTPTPNLIHSAASDHSALHSGHSSPDLPKSIGTQKPKSHYNSTLHSKTIHKPADNPKNATIHPEVPSTSEQNPSNQRKDPFIRQEPSSNSSNMQNKSSNVSHSTPKPRGKTKTTCPNSIRSTTTVKRNRNKTVSTSSTHGTIAPTPASHTDHEEMASSTHGNVTPTSTSHTDHGGMASSTHETIPTPANHTDHEEMASSTHGNVTPTSASHTDHGGMASSTHETIPTPANHTDHGDTVSSTHGTITPAPASHIDHGELITHGTNTGTSEKLTAYTKNTAPKPKTTSIPTSSINKPKNITLTTETIKISVKTTINPAGNKGSTETGRPTVKVTGDRPVNVTPSHPNKTEVNSQVPIGSLTVTTSSTELKLTTSEAPDKMSHPHQDKDGSQGSLDAGVVGENDSFPVWAIVTVVLLAVILLLVFLGLIFLVSYMTRKRHALIQNSDDNNSEDDHGPNSYPVYLMEQQTLGMGKIPRPQ